MSKEWDDSLPKTRRHLHLYNEDWELLERVYGRDSVSKIGASAAIRKIIHDRCVRLRQKLADMVDEAEEGTQEPERQVEEMDI